MSKKNKYINNIFLAKKMLNFFSKSRFSIFQKLSNEISICSKINSKIELIPESRFYYKEYLIAIASIKIIAIFTFSHSNGFKIILYNGEKHLALSGMFG